MRRAPLLLAVDAAAFAGFVGLATTGVLIRWTLPPGSGHRSTVLGLDRHGWGELHFWISVAFLAALAVHLLLHARWIASAVRGRAGPGQRLRIALGVVALAALLGLALAPLLAPVETVEGTGRGPRAGPRWEGPARD